MRELQRTVAELEAAQKHELSHRGQALRRLMSLLREAA
ncbi:MAG TPA: non-canonical purine NTP pyrophosphatase [Burkholderiales bacterium]